MNKENSKKSSLSQFTILEEMKNINIPYESLKPLEPEIDTVSMFQKLKEILKQKNSDWTLQIGVINYLRRLLKFDKNVFNQFFYGTKIYSKLIELINSVRSSLSKNVLIIFNEIFSEFIPENKNSIISLIKDALPYLIQKINSNQSFIKVESQLVLDNICKNVKFPELLLLILQQMNNISKISPINNNIKNKDKIFDIMINMFTKSAKNIGKDLFKENQEFPDIIKSLISFYEMNKSEHGKFCKNILNCLIDIMTKENFDTKMEKCTKKEKDDINDIIELNIEKNKKMRENVSSIHFRNNLKERKKSLKLSKCNNILCDKGNKSVSIKFVSNNNNEDFINNAKNIMIKLHHNDENIQKN